MTQRTLEHHLLTGRAGFSLSRALFRKNVGPSLIYEYRPTEFTRHTQWQCCHHRHFVKDSHNIIICTQKRLDTKIPARHTKSFSYYFNYFRHVAMLQKFAGLLVGAPFLWGPLFGRTCWTCLNPPLRVLDKSRTVQLADATGDFACLVFVLLAASARPRFVQSASWCIRGLLTMSSYRINNRPP